MNNSDMPAMACVVEPSDEARLQAAGVGIVLSNTYHKGLTKREHFAAMAMQGILATDVEMKWHQDDIGALAVEHADALLEALNISNEGKS